jgi:hypothetical protein
MKADSIQAMVIDPDEKEDDAFHAAAKGAKIIVIIRNGGGRCQKATLPDGTIIYVCGPA